MLRTAFDQLGDAVHGRHGVTHKCPSTIQSCILNPAATTGAAKAEFSKAGIPDEVTTKVLRQYHYYQRWDIDTKLRPALELWVKQLGSQRLSERLLKHPRLLVRTPAECSVVYLGWCPLE
ncbi:hypothetical protein ABBQ32_008045 [Trebouxia sp. C0010 RCD-2024]